jgi:hypothetical protein
MITIKHIAKYVVGLGEKVAPTDIEEGMRYILLNYRLFYLNYIKGWS